MRNALKSLKQDHSIMILSADKDCAIVVLDTKLLPLQDVNTDRDRTVQTPEQRPNRLLEPKSHGKAATTQTKREPTGDRINQDQAESETTTQNLRRTKNTQSQRTAYGQSGHQARILCPLTGNSSYTVKN